MTTEAKRKQGRPVETVGYDGSIRVRMEVERVERMRRAAEREGLSLADYIRRHLPNPGPE